jgi:predicted ATPase
MSHSPRGSLWNRWDLHFHTPSSFDYGYGGATNPEIVDRLVAEGLRVVAITDHHVLDIDRIRELQRLGKGQVTFLPGMELRDDHGAKPINYIMIFSEDCDLEHVRTTLQGKLNLTDAAIHAAGGHDRVYVPIEDGAQCARALGGVISIHAGAKSNSIEGIQNHEQFQQRIKYNITKQHVDIMEIGQLKDIDIHLEKIFPTTRLEKPLVLCSDNHDIRSYSTKAPLWIRADPTFVGLLMLLREPRDRVCIGGRPPELIRLEQNRTKIVRGLTFERRQNAPPSEVWFNGSIEFNPGLVAIVGNKGSGKSALADTLGLLGATKNSASFSFLSSARFCHATSGLAHHFDATLTWESGEKARCCLADLVGPGQVERIKYLPQDHVELVCNELANLREEGFEKELKSVIFSHVPEAERLGYTSLDDLVRFRTDERQKRIDSLIKNLKELSRLRAAHEARGDPIARRELEERVKSKQKELETHIAAEPPPVSDPSKDGGADQIDATVLLELRSAEAAQKRLEVAIQEANEGIRQQERIHAVAVRLLEKLENIRKDFHASMDSLAGDAAEIGIDADSLAGLTIDFKPAREVETTSARHLTSLKDRLEAQDPAGLRPQLAAAIARVFELQNQLDAPHRAYQLYLNARGEWNARKAVIEGADSEPESLLGLKAALAALNRLPNEIEEFRSKQAATAIEIVAEKKAQAAVYRKLYGAVQAFIDSHSLAKNKLRLEFRAELANDDFQGKLLSFISQNRTGSFMGVDDGRARADSLVVGVDWVDADSVRVFLESVDKSLHVDMRPEKGTAVQLKDQLAKGRRAEEVFDLIYGLEYVRPRYVLKWEGKDLSMLSPGERGTLLLVFYLLIDKSDLPLLIDQPEGNLDNHTVAKVLVECIKEARKRRQVFIVTHNPNLAVVCDADQVVHVSIDKTGGNAITYISGALENPLISRHVTDVLEGTRWAFDVRRAKYEVGSRDVNSLGG